MIRKSLACLCALGALAGCGQVAAPSVTSIARPGGEELCRIVPLGAVTASLGEAWQRVEDPAGGCRYQSRLRRTATLTVASTGLTAAAFASQASARGGTVQDRDGVLVADYESDGFGALDELWWSDGQARLILRADNEVTLDQALAVLALARRGGDPGTTVSTGVDGAAVPSASPVPPPPEPVSPAPSAPAPPPTS